MLVLCHKKRRNFTHFAIFEPWKESSCLNWCLLAIIASRLSFNRLIVQNVVIFRCLYLISIANISQLLPHYVQNLLLLQIIMICGFVMWSCIWKFTPRGVHSTAGWFRSDGLWKGPEYHFSAGGSVSQLNHLAKLSPWLILSTKTFQHHSDITINDFDEK